MNWTDDQKKVIETRGSNLLISAAAGSGKTAVLTERLLSRLLDKEDPINEAYMLDVSSAGSEKPLRLEKLAKYVGEFVNVHLVNPYEGYNFLEGDLKEVTEEEIKLEIRVKGRKKTLSLARSNIDKARLAIKF